MRFLRYVSRPQFSLIEYIAISVCSALLGLEQWPWAFAVLIGAWFVSGLFETIAARRKP
jgi:hypothetical protein